MEKGTITVSAIYPRDEGSTFDMSYYLSHHMPMVAKAWGPFGMVSWSVMEIPAAAGGAGGAEPPYSVHTLMTWVAKGETGTDGIGAALASEGGQAAGKDVPNFSNRTPTIMVGNVVAGGTV